MVEEDKVGDLRAAGAEVDPLYCESDGTFPNHHPDPTVDVTFGEQTWDEMMIAYVNWVPLDELLLK